MTEVEVAPRGSVDASDHELERPLSVVRSSLGVLVAITLREWVRMVRDPARPVGVVLQPVLFWLLFGTGLRDVFRIEAAPGMGYAEWFYPGAIAMTILFSAIFGTITVIEDRQAGFLQSFLVAPAHRAAIALGKMVGVGGVVALQLLVFVVVAAWVGYAPELARVPVALAAVLVATAFILSVTILLAWWSRSSHAYHAVMSAALLPSWVLSGAIFPRPEGWLGTVMAINPMTWHVDTLRWAFGVGGVPELPAASLAAAGVSTAVAMVALVFGVRGVRGGGAE